VKELLHFETAVETIGTLRRRALQQIFSGFALLLTSVGIPLFLAGEEFADIHDLDSADSSQKMGDPVDFLRAQLPGHKELRASVKDLVNLRTSHPALQRNEVDLFYFHPTFDDDGGERVFAYCRTGGSPRGDAHTRQVVVVANCGPRDYPNFDFDAGQWPWQRPPSAESGEVGIPPQWIAQNQQLRLALKPFQIRVFTM
jgi:1,4-alpha-glucan branching enzyme